jgi:hypothetical protein
VETIKICKGILCDEMKVKVTVVCKSLVFLCSREVFMLGMEKGKVVWEMGGITTSPEEI